MLCQVLFAIQAQAVTRNRECSASAAHFTGLGTGQFASPVFVVPGSLTDENIERLS